MYYDVGAKAQIYLLKGFTRLFLGGGVHSTLPVTGNPANLPTVTGTFASKLQISTPLKKHILILRGVQSYRNQLYRQLNT